jgi:thioredoxin reductase
MRMRPPERDVEVVVVGGGAAGRSAALVLGRCLRRAVVVDAGRPRNRFTARIHAVPTRDGVAPARWLGALRREVARFDTIETASDAVTAVRRLGRRRFVVETASGRTIASRTVLLATGVVDRLPAVEGLEALYGTSVFHCPICDAYELRGKRLAALGNGRHGVAAALGLSSWSDDVVLLSHGGAVGSRERASASSKARSPASRDGAGTFDASCSRAGARSRATRSSSRRTRGSATRSRPRSGARSGAITSCSSTPSSGRACPTSTRRAT